MIKRVSCFLVHLVVAASFGLAIGVILAGMGLFFRPF